jgi:hypothetical protein
VSRIRCPPHRAVHATRSRDGVVAGSSESLFLWSAADGSFPLRDFLLKPELLRAISDLGFEHPSEGEPVSLSLVALC